MLAAEEAEKAGTIAPHSFSPALLAFLFLLLTLPRIAFHEMWRDELDPWAVALQSHSFSDVANASRYGGHPLLWPFLLFLISSVFRSPVAMQVLHVLIATVAVFVAAKYAPFSRWQKVLLPLGYYFFFEYSVISRNYALGVLLTFVACALFCASRRRWLLLGIVLFLLCQTSVFGVIIALGLGAAVVLKTPARDGRATEPAARGRASLVIATLVCGALVSAVQMIPPPDGTFAPAWLTALDPLVAARCLARVWTAYVPLPEFGIHFWNTNVLDSVKPLQAVLGLGLCFGIPLVLRRSWPAIALWTTATTGTLLFFYVKYMGYQRHHGHLFIIFIASLWLSRSAPSGVKQNGTESDRAKAPGPPSILLTLLLAVHACAGLYAAGMDIVFPFSASEEVAQYLACLKEKNLIVVAHADHAGAPVAIRLQTPFYYPASHGFSIRRAHVSGQQKYVPDSDLYASAIKLRATYHRKVYLLMNYRIPPHPDFVLVRTFGSSIVQSEEYYLWMTQEPAT